MSESTHLPKSFKQFYFQSIQLSGLRWYLSHNYLPPAHFQWFPLDLHFKFVIVRLPSHVQLLLDPMGCSPPSSSVHGVFQARIPEWVAISFSKGSSRPRDQTHVSCIFCTGRQILYHLGSHCRLTHFNVISDQKYIAWVLTLILCNFTGKILEH